MTTAGIPTITLLGPFALRVEGREVMELPRKGQALLAFLAMQPDRRVSRELVADLLWTQSGEAQARHSLRQLLVVLRRTPARDVIRTSAEKVWIDGTSIEVDALALEADARAGDPEALLRAASCCRGALLQDIPAISHAFEEWLRPQRARMAGVMARTLRRLAASQTATGAFDEASGTAARLVEMDTLDEAAHRLLMDCLARAGRRAEALQQFEFCVRTLRRELDVSPDPETVALADRIRVGNGSDDTAVPHAPIDGAGGAQTGKTATADGDIAIGAAPPSRPRHTRLARFAGAAAACLAVCFLGGSAIRRAPVQASVISTNIRDVSGMPSQDGVVAGFNDLVKIRLATRQHLRVAAETVPDAEGSPPAADGMRQAGENRYQLAGSASFDGNAMHIAVHLTDALRGTELWSRHYDRPISDAVPVADDIAVHIARAVPRDQSLFERSPRGPFADGRRIAHELVALGHQMDFLRSAPDTGAKDVYRLALEFNEDDVDALAHLATVYIRSVVNSSPVNTVALNEADTTLRRAMLLDPTNAFVLFNTCLLRRLQGRIADAIAICQRTLDIDPHYAGALRELGHDFLEAGDAPHAIVSYRAAIDSGPYLPLVHNAFKGMGVAFLALGNFKEAIENLRKSALLDASQEDDERLWLAAMLDIDGSREEAARMLADFMARHPGLNVGVGYLRLLCAPIYAARRTEVLAALADASQFVEGPAPEPAPR